tara:strand:- start:28 stop:555 length:528 start_codon:yes stop_codon:yes gene_type:complete
MQIFKELNKKVLRDYFFIKGQLNIDCNYFIEKIQKGVNQDDNMSNKTNVRGKMTSWEFFNNDINFVKQVIQFNKYLDQNYELPIYSLTDAWGFINYPGEKTTYHTHDSVYSGVIYLNDCDQPLLFKEINQKVDPKAGSFALFSGWLQHGCDINDTETPKFGISFNCNGNLPTNYL